MFGERGAISELFWRWRFLLPGRHHDISLLSRGVSCDPNAMLWMDVEVLIFVILMVLLALIAL